MAKHMAPKKVVNAATDLTSKTVAELQALNQVLAFELLTAAERDAEVLPLLGIGARATKAQIIAAIVEKRQDLASNRPVPPQPAVGDELNRSNVASSSNALDGLHTEAGLSFLEFVGQTTTRK